MPIDAGSGGPLAAVLGILGLLRDDNDPPIYVTCQNMQALLDHHGIAELLACNIDPAQGVSDAGQFVTDITGLVVDDIAGQIEPIIGEINTGIAGFVDAGDSVLDNILGRVNDLLGGLFGDGSDSINTLARQILQAIGQTSQGAILNVNGVTNQVLGNIDLGAGTAIGVITNLFGLSQSTLSDLLRDGSGFLEAITDRALQAINETLGLSADSFNEIFDNVGDAMILNLVDATEQNRIVSGKIIEGLDEQLRQSALNAETARGDLTSAIEAITGESESALATTREAFEESSTLEADATTAGAEQVAGSVAGGFEVLTQKIADVASTLGTGTDPETLNKVRDSISAIVAQTGCPPDAGPIIEAFIIELFGRFSLLGAAAQAQLALASFETFIGPVLQVFSNCISQAAARQVPTSLPGAPDLREQLNRRLIDQDAAVNALLNQGFSIDRALALLEQRKMLPDIGLIQTWFLRGFESTEQSIVRLADLGLDNDAIENIIQMAFFIPPVGDLITMMVRDVFNPVTTQKFGQFQEFPQEFTQYAQQQGVSEEWARRYWAAHWSLPSPQQGFEMFQRDVINEDELDTLLKALDVMPFWRDALKQIAYRPMPRVDIRRMNKLGLIPNEALQGRYQQFGFSPEDAALMADFTMAYNGTGNAESAQEITGVTRSMALKLFRQGALTREQTNEILLDQGISQEAANILIQNELVEDEIEQRQEQTALIIEQAKAGSLTFEQAQDKLGQLGLEPTELARGLTKLERVRATATKIPTRADADRFIKAGIINDSQYIDLLERNGYSQVWSERYLQAARA